MKFCKLNPVLWKEMNISMALVCDFGWNFEADDLFAIAFNQRPVHIESGDRRIYWQHVKWILVHIRLARFQRTIGLCFTIFKIYVIACTRSINSNNWKTERGNSLHENGLNLACPVSVDLSREIRLHGKGTPKIIPLTFVMSFLMSWSGKENKIER